MIKETSSDLAVWSDIILQDDARNVGGGNTPSPTWVSNFRNLKMFHFPIMKADWITQIWVAVWRPLNVGWVLINVLDRTRSSSSQSYNVERSRSQWLLKLFFTWTNELDVSDVDIRAFVLVEQIRRSNVTTTKSSGVFYRINSPYVFPISLCILGTYVPVSTQLSLAKRLAATHTISMSLVIDAILCKLPMER